MIYLIITSVCWLSCLRDKETVSCPTPKFTLGCWSWCFLVAPLAWQNAYESYIKHYTLTKAHQHSKLKFNPCYQAFIQQCSQQPAIHKCDLITFLSQPVTCLPWLRLEHIEDRSLVHLNPIKSVQMVVISSNHSNSAWNLYTLSQYTMPHLIWAEDICSLLRVSHWGQRGKRCWMILLQFTGPGRRQIWWLFLSNKHGMFWS